MRSVGGQWIDKLTVGWMDDGRMDRWIQLIDGQMDLRWMDVPMNLWMGAWVG